jgi:hypothetical protein
MAALVASPFEVVMSLTVSQREERRTLMLNGIVAFLLLGLCVVIYNNLLHLWEHSQKQEANQALLQAELTKARTTYMATRRTFTRAFDASQRTVIIKERYGLVHPQDLQVKWGKEITPTPPPPAR